MWSIAESNPEGRAYMTIVIGFAIVAFSTFGMRIYSRRLQTAAFDASDYTCLLSLVLDMGLVVIMFGGLSHGWGENITMFGLEDARFAAHAFIALHIIWCAAAVSVRSSILLFYIHIFAVRRFRMICWAIIALSVANLISIILATCLICRPILYSFDKTLPNGHCGDIVSFERYIGIWTLISDSIIVVLPMPMLWRLQMPTKKKIGLSIILGMGVIICAHTLTRIICSVYYETSNPTKAGALITLITVLEPIFGVIVACLPFLPLIFKTAGQSRLCMRSLATFKSKNSSTKPSSENLRPNHIAQFQGLPDVEMNPVKGLGFVTSYTSTGSRSSIPESGTCDEYRGGQYHIFVRQDFFMQSEQR